MFVRTHTHTHSRPPPLPLTVCLFEQGERSMGINDLCLLSRPLLICHVNQHVARGRRFLMGARSWRAVGGLAVVFGLKGKLGGI